MPTRKVPQHPSITGTLPHWQGVGDEVDCLLSVARDQQRELILEWWYCVVIKEAGPKTVQVFWVGTPPKLGSRRQLASGGCNPSIVLRKHLRSHRGDAYFGGNTIYNVAFIRQNYIPQQHGAAPLVSVNSDQNVAGKDKHADREKLDSTCVASGGAAASEGLIPALKPKSPKKSPRPTGKGKGKSKGKRWPNVKEQSESGSAGRQGSGSPAKEQKADNCGTICL